jgi:hypothetical protein
VSAVEGAYRRGKISSIDGFEIGTIGHYTSEQGQMKGNKTGLLIKYVD